MKTMLLWLLLPTMALADVLPMPLDPATRELKLRAARRKRGGGIALVVVGAVTAIGGAVCIGYGAQGGGDPFGVAAILLGAGISGELLGTAMWISGAVLWSSAQSQLRALAPPPPALVFSTPVWRF